MKKVFYFTKVKKNVFIYKESIVYPLVEFESNCSKKEDQIFLGDNR